MEIKELILCDTNILIEIYKSNASVINEVKNINSENIVISHVTCAELIFGARNKDELSKIKKDLSFLKILSLSQEISKLGIDLMSKYSLSHRLNFPDCLIAATSLIHDLKIYTLNIKDFHYIPEIKLYKQD